MKKISGRLPFIIPPLNVNLAEFCGVMLGDGGLSKYQASITLHSIDDREYSTYLAETTEKLFGIQPGIYERKSAKALTLFISRIGIVEFLTNVCGLKIGNKVSQGVTIPPWIEENNAFKIACMRGLMDTDGSIFIHSYISKGKRYNYKKLSYTSASEPLLESAYSIFQEQGLHARFGSNKDVRIDSKADMERYFEIFGSHNPKHLKRYAS